MKRFALASRDNCFYMPVRLTGGQSRTQSNAYSRVRLALALGKRNVLRMISYALT